MTSQEKRVAAAVSIIAALGTLVWASGYMGEVEVGQGSVADAAATPETLLGHYASEGDFVAGLFERIATIPETGGLPDGFAEEVMNPYVWGECDVYSTGGVVGFVWPVVLDDAEVQEALELGGWERVAASEEGNTYVKRIGCYRWLHVSSTRTTEATTVVFTYEKGDG